MVERVRAPARAAPRATTTATHECATTTLGRAEGRAPHARSRSGARRPGAGLALRVEQPVAGALDVVPGIGHPLELATRSRTASRLGSCASAARCVLEPAARPSSRAPPRRRARRAARAARARTSTRRRRCRRSSSTASEACVSRHPAVDRVERRARPRRALASGSKRAPPRELLGPRDRGAPAPRIRRLRQRVALRAVDSARRRSRRTSRRRSHRRAAARAVERRLDHAVAAGVQPPRAGQAHAAPLASVELRGGEVLDAAAVGASGSPCAYSWLRRRARPPGSRAPTARGRRGGCRDRSRSRRPTAAGRRTTACPGRTRCGTPDRPRTRRRARRRATSSRMRCIAARVAVREVDAEQAIGARARRRPRRSSRRRCARAASGRTPPARARAPRSPARACSALGVAITTPSSVLLEQLRRGARTRIASGAQPMRARRGARACGSAIAATSAGARVRRSPRMRCGRSSRRRGSRAAALRCVCTMDVHGTTAFTKPSRARAQRPRTPRRARSSGNACVYSGSGSSRPRDHVSSAARMPCDVHAADRARAR